jgi:hypothetical protein
VQSGFSLVLIIASLFVGAWCFVAVARDRWVGASHLVALAALELALFAQAVAVAIRMIGGERPAQMGTFIGYLVTSVLLLPLAIVLTFLERTRWGAVIAGGGAIVAAVVVLRLRQVWAIE